MNIVLFGCPASGKGTQAQHLAKHYGISHISTGEIFRKNMEDKTPLGVEIDEIMKSGNLVSDEITCKIVLDTISKQDGWILDGFPRSLPQAKILLNHIVENKLDVRYVYLDLDRDVAIERSLSRFKDSGRPEDGDINTINKRLDIFQETSVPAINWFEPEILRIDASRAEDEVLLSIMNVLEY